MATLPPERLVFRSARTLAAELASRKLSAAEVMRAFLTQIERVNPRVNAIVTLRPAEELLAEAKKCLAVTSLHRRQVRDGLRG